MADPLTQEIPCPNFQRRDFLTGAAAFAAAATAALVGTRRAEAGDPSFMNNVPDPLLSGKELPTFKFALEKSKGKVIGNSYGKEATVEQLPISKGIAGVSMRLEPGAMRELHWHATAAEWAFVIEGPGPDDGHRPGGICRDERLRAGRRVVLPARPRPHARMPGRRAVPLHPDLRQRLLLGVRHVQHHRLDRPHPQAAAGEELRPPRIDLRRVPEERGVLRPRGGAAGEAGRLRSQGWKLPPQTHKYRLLAQPPHASTTREAGCGVVDSTKFPISKTITGAILDLDPGALRELHWHPTADEWQYVIEGKISVTMFGSRGRYRIETLEKGDVGYIPQGYGHSIENVGNKPCRVLIGFNTGVYETIDLSQWIAGNPTDVLATNFSKPAALFEKFPQKDVFIVAH